MYQTLHTRFLYEYMKTFKVFSSLTGTNTLGEIYIRA